MARKTHRSPGSLYQFFPNKEAIAQAFAADATEHLHRVYDTLLSSEVMALPLQAFFDTFVDRIIAFNRNYPGYLALELGSTLSSSLALAIADLQQGVQARLDALLAAYWPHSTPEQRHLPLLVSYRLFLALLPLALLYRTDTPIEEELSPKLCTVPFLSSAGCGVMCVCVMFRTPLVN